MTKTIENLFANLATFSDLLTVLLFFVFFPFTRTQKAIFIITIGCFVCFILGFLSDYPSLIIRRIIYSAFTLIEYSFFALFIARQIINAKFRKLISLLSSLFIGFLIIYFSTTHTPLDSVPIGIETILILLFAFYYFYEQMNEVGEQFVYNKFHFWIIVGMIIYLAGSFFIYIFINQLKDNNEIRHYWVFTNIFYILKNILFSIGILTYVKQVRNPSPKNLRPYLN